MLKEFGDNQRSTVISHDPLADGALQLVADEGETLKRSVTAKADQTEQVWVELLRDGLTFDLSGIAPGPCSAIPEIDQRFDLEQSPASARLEPLILAPGQHLTGGEASMPVVKTLMALACDMINHFDDLVAVAWQPARSVIGRRYFESVATAWLDGGAFPALGLTSFRETNDGALQSVGLDFWIGQELRIEPPLSSDKVDATRLGVRIINQLVMIGGLDQSERVTAPDGSRLVMRPSRNGKFVRVSHE
uniref:hypothetical protein n=1 Tax=uncultured Erythrobacter sp. TaxID=263913 RepID=UPI00261C69F2|nr:hypothetical protein [uncultured Erythrobacter sp.]